MSREYAEHLRSDHKTQKIEVWDDEGAPHWIFGKYIVCSTCRGKGSHVNSAIDGNGITESEILELGDDFMVDYMDGLYDVPCTDCEGIRVVLTIDRDACTIQECRWFENSMADLMDEISVQASEASYFGYDR